MQNLWNDLVGDVADDMPKFNDDLLLRFRERKISEIPEYLNTVSVESMKMVNNMIQYHGYKEATPEERMEYILTNPIINKCVDIQRSDFMQLRFSYTYEGRQYYMVQNVPFMRYGCIVLNDTEYYPLFPIVERGGLHRTSNSIIIKVMRAPLTHRRQDTYVITTTDGSTYLERILTIKIHQGSRRGKKTDRTPMIIYHLVKLGLVNTLKLYKFKPDEFELVTSLPEQTEKGYSYIEIRPDLFIKTKTSLLESDMYKRRFIVSLMRIFEDYKRFTLVDLMDPSATYFKVALGKYTYPSNNKPELLLTNAKAHLNTTDTLLDPVAQYQLSQMGIHAKDIYELILLVYYNMDKWIIGYEPTNLLDKKIGSLDQIMADIVRDINTKLFSIVNSPNGITQDQVIKFMRQASKHNGWFAGCSVFRANPTLYNDNLLLSIGAKRFRSLENTETRVGTKKSKSKKMPTNLLTAHPSQMVVESILDIPPSAPITTGSINPFLQITSDGCIIEPPWYNEISHVFD